MTERKKAVEVPENGVLDVSGMNIYKKMLAIESELSNVRKNLVVSTGGSGSYKAVSERDVLDAVKPLETRYGIYSYPYERKIIENEIVSLKSTFKDKTSERNQYRLRIEVTYRFINTDNPSEVIDVTSYGDGIDSGDKATGKAMTYADKYALMKAYKISTGDDPDQEASPEDGYEKAKSNSKKESKKEAKIEMSISPDLVTAINYERGQLGRYGIDVRSDKFISFMKSKTGFETTDPAKHTNASGTKLLSFLKGVRKAKSEQADVPDKVMDYDTGEVIDNDDLPF